MTVYYHWWGAPQESPQYSNLRVPLLLSIATLRACNPTIPIIVLDLSDYEPMPSDWLHFPEKLNFQFHRLEGHLKKNYSCSPGHKHLSRLFDLRRATDGHVIYCDADVFWFRDVLPLATKSNRFHFNGYNTGFFYYHPSESVDRFFELFEAYTIGALNNLDIRKQMQRYVGYQAWYEVWDEMTCTFIANEHADLIERLPPHEHVTVKHLPDHASEMKMIHCNGLMVNNPVAKRKGEKEHSRGLACLIVKELYEKLTSVLSEDDLKLIFTDAERHSNHPMLSIHNPEHVKKLLATQDSNGHYHLQRWCNRTLLV